MTAIASALLIVGLLIASIEMFAVNQGFFESEYAKLNTADDIGITESDLTRVTQTLLDYTTGKIDTLDMQAERSRGEVQEVFGEREKAHMCGCESTVSGRTRPTHRFADRRCAHY